MCRAMQKRGNDTPGCSQCLRMMYARRDSYDDSWQSRVPSMTMKLHYCVEGGERHFCNGLPYVLQSFRKCAKVYKGRAWARMRSLRPNEYRWVDDFVDDSEKSSGRPKPWPGARQAKVKLV